MRNIYNMNFNWYFYDGEIANTCFESVHSIVFETPRFMKAANCGIGKVGYPTEDWDEITVPHDLRHYRAVYDKNVPNSQGFLSTGVAWYRKEFFLDASDEGKSVTIDFDGVFRDCEVYVNASFIGRHLSGYTSFNFDITDFVEFGENNAIAVRVDATKFEGWWYEAGGIYRDVRLVVTDKLKVKQSGIQVISKTEGDNAEITVNTELSNIGEKSGTATINYKILDKDGKAVATASNDVEITAYKDQNTSQTIKLENITRWDIDNTYKYSVDVEVVFAGEVVDNVNQVFGIRDIEFNYEKGLILNGRQVKVQGVCVHDDFAGVGGAMSREVIRQKIYLLKQMGCNGYRCSHNPPSPYLIEACDDFGILVMDEVRLMSSSKEYMGQMIDLIKRDRNNPSVFIWSIGNEEMAVHGTKLAVRSVNNMLRVAHELDSTRPCTYANNCNWRELTEWHEENGLHMDVFGLNYNCMRNFDTYDIIHEKFTDRCMIGTENASTLTTRGQYLMREEEKDMSYFSETAKDIMIYANEKRKYNVSEYCETYPTWGSTPMETMAATDRDFVAGYFIWTGFDYRGELIPFDWPGTVSRFGIMDLCGFMKDAGHHYRVKWAKEPTIHMYPHWTFEDGIGEIQVDLVSNTDEVELFVNGVSMGRRPSPKREVVKYYVEYKAGETVAVAYNDGKEVARVSHKTAGEPCKINLEIVRDRAYEASGEDNVFVKVDVLDKDGIHCPNANNKIDFDVDGVGTFVGCGNGDPLSMEDDLVPSRKLFNGLALAILKTTEEMGTIKFTASSKGLESASIEVKVENATTKEPILLAKDGENNSVQREKDDSDGAF
ncbi:MAG: glycoside hydrolase family 2 TIM barrel-domain containing protein [Clostridia bacterium]